MKRHALSASILGASLLLLCTPSVQAQTVLTVHANRPGATIGNRHYGIFFEEINHAGDGGLYAELIRNRSFEDNATAPDSWTPLNNASIELTTTHLLNEAQGQALQLTCNTAASGICNEGFWGINVVKDRTYQLSFWIRSDENITSSFSAELLSNDRSVRLGSTLIEAVVTDTWSKVTAEITALASDTQGCFALVAQQPCTVYLDVISLFPPTYKNRPNGCRPDMAQMLADMKPSFMRFPGGCYIEGQFDNNSTNRFEWKKTIGPIETRPGHLNRNWNYRVSDGMGFHEFLQLSEDLNAEPLFVVNIGMGHGWVTDYQNIGEYIQEALDAIEYANGDITTPYGRQRAANGHPAPFNLRLLEIGNENYNFFMDGNWDQSDHYPERYYAFYQAIKAKYPDMTLIGNVEAWATDQPSWRNSYPVEIVDEHYYRSPLWFTNQYEKYDAYSRSAYKIYAGEYAVTQNFGTTGNLNAALGEAVYMLGMERNSDVCVMNSYAPIFVNENDQAWRPDMIRFNSSTCYGTPSYHVQQLLSNHLGKQNVLFTETNNTYGTSTRIGIGTWLTSAVFDDIRLTDGSGNVIMNEDFSTHPSTWELSNGWTVGNGQLIQASAGTEGSTAIYQTPVENEYCYEVKATKKNGSEGFLIVFDYQDKDNYYWWNLGGWGNTKHGIQMFSEGDNTLLCETEGSIETGNTYTARVHVRNNRVRCYLNDELIHDITLPTRRNVYASTSIDYENGQLFVKMVNPRGTVCPITLAIDGGNVNGGQRTVLASASNLDENNLSSPDRVSPVTDNITFVDNRFTYNVPPYSLTLFQLDITGAAPTEQPDIVLPSPILSYNFENGQPTDASGTYTGILKGKAEIQEMADGNHALYTGPIGGGGYLDLGAQNAKNLLSQLTGDYSISIDLYNTPDNNLAAYCWAYAFGNGTDTYLGLINKAGNTDWYYEAKRGENTYNAHSNSGLNYEKWHNITYVQHNGQGQLYLDGFTRAKMETGINPSDIAAVLTEACIGKSPYSADRLMEGCYFDNLRIYDQALTADMIGLLAKEAASYSTTSPEQIQTELDNAISEQFSLLHFLHGDTQLPVQIEDIQLSWTLTATYEEGYVELENGTIKVLRQPEGTCLKVAQLAVDALLPTGEHLNRREDITLAPREDYYGYLYCFMNANTEITNFALGLREDLGHRFHVLLNGNEVFDTYQLAVIEHGTRDAFMARGEENDGYFITATDMKQHASGVWNNYGMDLLRSSDLIHWTGKSFDFRQGKRIFSDPEAVTGCYNTDAEYARIYRVWAPQFIWDKDYNNGEGGYLVYYSLLSSNNGDTYDKIYYSYTDRTFSTLTQPRLFFDPGRAVIDGDIVYNPYDGLYHMFFKKEGADGTERGTYEAVSPTLTGGEWKEMLHITNEGSELVEAATALRRINEDKYNLYYMRYTGGSAYKYCELNHLGLSPSASLTLQGNCAAQHGSIFAITQDEYVTLQNWSDIMLLLPQVKSMLESSDNNAGIAAAINKAEEALELNSVSELAVALPAAYAALLEACQTYEQTQWEKALAGQAADLSFLIQNADFNSNDTSWKGSSALTINEGVGEFYNTTFNMYQELKGMPAGTYKLTCQGFYRNGDIATAYLSHTNNSEQLNASLYLNDNSTSLMSLYDSRADYTYRPYTYPDNMTQANLAFNTDGNYGQNAVECTLPAEGTLRIGVRKLARRSSDWTCFDNFRLQYLGRPTGIANAEINADKRKVNVYTVNGQLIRKQTESTTATQGLPAGVYLIENKKVVVD